MEGSRVRIVSKGSTIVLAEATEGTAEATEGTAELEALVWAEACIASKI